MFWLLAAAAGWLLFVTAAAGTLVPLPTGDRLIYVFAGPTLASFLIWTAVGLGALAGLSLTRRFTGAPADGARWPAPFAALGLVALGALPAVPGIDTLAAPAAFVVYDLRWWWLGAAAAVTAISLVRVRTSASATSSPRRSAAWLPPVLASLVMAWISFTSPHLRFSGTLHGDEPKYLRYAEVWIQGGGLAIDEKRPYRDDRTRTAPAFDATLRAAMRAAGEEARAIGSDVSASVRNPTGFQWHRARGAYGFVNGRRGGVYQIHNPGVSALLLPGYLIDRLVIRAEPGETGEFPAHIPATNVVMLIAYGACALALFALLRDALGSPPVAAAWTAAAMLTLPTAAFPFQLYPELPALLAILVLTRFTLFGDPNRAAAAAAAGLLAAGLLWLHPRFLLVSGVFAIVGFAVTRASARRSFAIGYALALATVLLFEYRVTGSLSPAARWTAIEGGQTIDLRSIPINLAGYAIDRTWGVLPHAPLLVLALPGLIVLGRAAPRSAILLLAVSLALAVPAAGHSLSAAGGTPGRLVLAVVPLAFWPIGVLVSKLWRRPGWRAAVVLLALLSLDAATSYNLHHVKHVGPLRAPGSSGWRPNLLFPEIRGGDPVSATNLLLLNAVLLAIVAITVLALLGTRRPDRASRARTGVGVISTGSAALALQTGGAIVVATAIAIAAGLMTDPDYMPDERSAFRLAAAALTAPDRCVLCLNSRDGPTDWTRLQPNEAASVYSEPDVEGRTLTLTVRLGPEAAVPSFGRVRVEFGDGSAAGWTSIVQSRVFEYRYAQAGTYRILTTARVRGGELRRHEITIAVR